MRLIACRSKNLSHSEKNYHVHEKEILALEDTLEEWRHYLLGADVRVFTDNSALTYLQKSPKPSPRQVRWLEKMQRYTLKIQHVPGRLISAADALSRHPVEESALALMVIEYSAKHSVSLVSVWFDGPICAPLRMGEEVSADWWSDYYADPVVRRKYFTRGTSSRMPELRDPTKWHQGRLWENDKIVVPLKR